MKKTFLFGMLALLLAGFGFGGISMAACDTNLHVACIGDVGYESLNAAVVAANAGDIIELQKNDEVSLADPDSRIQINKELIIDGRGHYVQGRSGDNTAWHIIYVSGTGDVTIKDMTIKNFGNNQSLGDGKISPLYAGFGYKGKLILEDVNIEGFNRQAIVIGGGNFEINGCTISGDNTRDFQQGIMLYTSGEGIIKNSTISGIKNHSNADVYGILHGGRGTITVENTTIIGDGAVAITSMLDEAGDVIGTHQTDGTIILGDGNNFNAGNVLAITPMGDPAQGTSVSIIKVVGGLYNGGIFKDVDDSVSGANFILEGGTYTVNPSAYLGTGYTVLEKDGKYVVETLKEAAEDSSNTSSVQIAEGTEISTGSNAPITLTGNIDLDAYLSGSAESGDAVISSLDETEKATIKDSGYDTMEVKGALSLDFGDTAKFSKPIAIRIKLSTTTTSGVKFKAKHKGGTFGFIGLTTNPLADCTDGAVSNSSDQYNGADVNPVNGYGIIYTCSASTFVAYTEAKNTTTNTNGGGGGGGSSYTPKPVVTNTGADANTGSNNAVSQDSQATSSTATESESDTNTNNEVTISDAAKAKYNEEQLAAYQWAYDNGITTISDADKARLDEPLTRAELAKMMSQYISSVLKKSPLKVDEPKYSDVDSSLGDLADFIVKAYQYQIMGINADGSALESFNPYGLVSRAEFATVFSRVLFGSKYNQAEGAYYELHLAALKEAGILSNDTPTIQEVRGWVMLMMYRSAQEKATATEEATVAEEESTTEENKEAEATTGATAEATTGSVAETTTGTTAEEPATDASTGAVAETTTGATAEATTGSTEGTGSSN